MAFAAALAAEEAAGEANAVEFSSAVVAAVFLVDPYFVFCFFDLDPNLHLISAPDPGYLC